MRVRRPGLGRGRGQLQRVPGRGGAGAGRGRGRGRGVPRPPHCQGEAAPSSVGEIQTMHGDTPPLRTCQLLLFTCCPQRPRLGTARGVSPLKMRSVLLITVFLSGTWEVVAGQVAGGQLVHAHVVPEHGLGPAAERSCVTRPRRRGTRLTSLAAAAGPAPGRPRRRRGRRRPWAARCPSP